MLNDAKKNVGKRSMFKMQTFLDFWPIHSIYKPHDMSLKFGTWFNPMLCGSSFKRIFGHDFDIVFIWRFFSASLSPIFPISQPFGFSSSTFFKFKNDYAQFDVDTTHFPMLDIYGYKG